MRKGMMSIIAILVLCLFLSIYFVNINKDFSYNVIAEIIGAIITVVIIESMLIRAEKKEWKEVKEKIDLRLKNKIDHVRINLMFAFNWIPTAIQVDNNEELYAHYLTERNNKLIEIGENDDNEILRELIDQFLNGDFGKLWKNSSNDIKWFIDMKYSIHLKPDVIFELFNLQEHLKRLDSSINIRNKWRGEGNQDIYKKMGNGAICYSIKEIAKSLVELKKLGYELSEFRDDPDVH